MKVIHIISSIDKTSGGPARSSQGLVVALNQAGVEAILVSCKVGDEPWVEGVQGFYAPTKAGFKTLKVFFVEVLQKEQPDLVHLHGIWQPQIHIAAQIARQLKIPYVETPRGMLEPWSLEQKKWKKMLALFLYQRKDIKKAIALHATADSEAEQFRKLGFRNQIIISPNGVNVPRVLPPRVVCEQKRSLFMSRMHHKKGVLELVEAWAQVKPQGWQCELVYTVSGAGENAYEARVKTRVKELGLSDQFIFTGALWGDAKWEAYRRADLFVLPTYSENFGIVIAEALYADVPVITTKGAPWAELEEYACGRWIETGVAPLVLALREIMALPDARRAEMGVRGSQLVASKYLWQSIGEKMKDAYLRLGVKHGGT